MTGKEMQRSENTTVHPALNQVCQTNWQPPNFPGFPLKENHSVNLSGLGLILRNSAGDFKRGRSVYTH